MLAEETGCLWSEKSSSLAEKSFWAVQRRAVPGVEGSSLFVIEGIAETGKQTVGMRQ